MSSEPIHERIKSHAERRALLAPAGTWTYGDLLAASGRAAAVLLAGARDLDGARVAIFADPGPEFLSALLATWRAGGVAVPLAVSHPIGELEHVARDSGASTIVAPPERAAIGDALSVASGARLLTTTALSGGTSSALLPVVDPARPALILYTSGTTGRSKGVVTSHANIAAQTTSLVTAWGWTAADRTMLVLPLHHVHGLVNVVTSALWAGAACEMPPRFDAEATWARLASGDITVFTAVPTIYHRLIASWDASPPHVQRARVEGARRVRLMMSGSAALPVSVLERWRDITGHTLLERYGMTEIGMALSNPLRGERRPGHVGQPLPDVEVRLVDEQGLPVPDGAAGEIEVRGPGVFSAYWQRPEETAAAFHDGWFRTGDVAICEAGAHRLLGRRSVDILKSGGHKISALEIEETLREHPAVAECAVVGIPDQEWGERICAAIEPVPGRSVTLPELTDWLAPKLAPYKHPRAIETTRPLPRNAMGKVVKPEVARWFQRP